MKGFYFVEHSKFLSLFKDEESEPNVAVNVNNILWINLETKIIHFVNGEEMPYFCPIDVENYLGLVCPCTDEYDLIEPQCEDY